MSNWKTEIEAEHDIKMFLCGQSSDLSENDKVIILELVEQLQNEDVSEVVENMSERICKCGHREKEHSRETFNCMDCHICFSFRLDKEHPLNKAIAELESHWRQRDFLMSREADTFDKK